MANEENLKKGVATQFRSGEEAAKEAGRRGGIASGKSRNLTARLKAWAEEGGYDLMVQKAEEAISEGNTKMWELVRDSIGEKPVEQFNIMNIDKSQERLEELLKDDNV